MHDAVYSLVVIWQLLLAGALTVYASRSRGIVERTLALDTLALVFVSVLTVVAIQHRRAGYLDVALAMGLLGFVQTVVVARLAEHRRDYRE